MSPAAPAEGTAGAVELPLRFHRRELAEKLQKLLELPPAVALAAEAVARLREASAGTGDTMFALLEIVTAAALVLLTVRELRPSGAEAPTRASALVDLAAAGMLFAEWGDHVAHGGKTVSPTLLSAFVALGLALLTLRRPDWRERRRVVRLDATGVHFRRSRLRGFRVAWAELTSIARDGARVTLQPRDGRAHRFDVGAVHGGEAIWAALAAAATRAGVAVSRDGVPAIVPGEGVAATATVVR